MNIVHKLAGIGAATALAAITVSVVAPQASAATYNGACGTGYTVIDHMAVGGTQQATTYLTYKGGWDCVVTIANSPGTSQYLETDIELSGSGTWHEQSGNFKVYAGPVYLDAPHHCVDWGGYAGFSGIVDLQWNDHCS